MNYLDSLNMKYHDTDCRKTEIDYSFLPLMGHFQLHNFITVQWLSDISVYSQGRISVCFCVNVEK